MIDIIVSSMTKSIDLSGTVDRKQCGHKRGSSKGFKWQKWTPHKLGRHPFNLITEEIIND